MMVECTANPRNHNERSIGKEFEKKEKKLYRNPISPKLNIKSKVIRALHDDLLTCYFSIFCSEPDGLLWNKNGCFKRFQFLIGCDHL